MMMAKAQQSAAPNLAELEQAIALAELEQAIATERAPAEARAKRVADISRALLAGPGPEERSDLEAELAQLKSQRHERSEKLIALLNQRKAVLQALRANEAASMGDVGDLGALTDEQLQAMRAALKRDMNVAHAELRTIGDEIVRRQSRAAAKARVDKLSREELLAQAAEIKARLEREG
jgi:hypothetical protein